jgi:hypothetical protein
MTAEASPRVAGSVANPGPDRRSGDGWTRWDVEDRWREPERPREQRWRRPRRR